MTNKQCQCFGIATVLLVALSTSVPHAMRAQSNNAPPMLDITGVWVSSMTIGQVTFIYRIDLIQKGADVTGYSRRELKGPHDSAHVVFPITGKSLGFGTRFTFREGSMMESDPPTRPWCALKSLTLTPTAAGTLMGSYEASPCQPGTFVLHRVK
jgi:hypothetical protein